MNRDFKHYLKILIPIIIGILVYKYNEHIGKFLSMTLDAFFPLAIGAIMAYCLNIVMSFYEGLLSRLKDGFFVKHKRAFALVFSIFTFILVIFIMLYLVLPQVIGTMANLVEAAPKSIKNLINSISNNKAFKYIADTLNINANLNADKNNIQKEILNSMTRVLNSVGNVFDSVFSTLSRVFSGLVTLLLAFIFSIYLLSGKEVNSRAIKRVLSTYLSEKNYNKFMYIVSVLDKNFHNYIVGQVKEAMILSCLCMIGMWIFRFPYALVVGVLMGIMALIPIAGAYISAFVGAMLMLTVSPMKSIMFLVFVVCLQQFEGNVIYPKVVGGTIGIPGILTLVAITVGGGMFGIVGMLFSVPITASIYTLIKEDIKRRDKKNVD